MTEAKIRPTPIRVRRAEAVAGDAERSDEFKAVIYFFLDGVSLSCGNRRWSVLSAAAEEMYWAVVSEDEACRDWTKTSKMAR
jgi:hypothetical protein